jgi:Zn-dependent protease
MSNSYSSPPEERRPSDEEPVVAELAEQPPVVPHHGDEPQPASAAAPRTFRRRKKLPLVLFLITCVSTWFAGATGWLPGYYLSIWALRLDGLPMRRVILSHWQDGLIYMACLLAILLTHEMGHFLATVKYHIPASFPFFVPFPISPIGTMGAVIGMDGRRADRRQTFDIGLAGPLAGLLVAAPVLWIGIQKLDLNGTPHGPFTLDTPLVVRLLLDSISPPGYQPGMAVTYSQLNPYFMAGWVGLLITGLNMLPVSQLDGGHVVYTLFGKRAYWIARGFLLLAVVYILWYRAWAWTLMVIILLLIGPDHPPTRDDTVPLGWFRTLLGWISLLIPVLCFPPHALQALN